MKLLFSCVSFICRVNQTGPSLMLKLSCYVALIYIATYWTSFLQRAYEIAVVVLSAWPSLCLSVCPCACLSIRQFGIFLRNGLLLFSHFWRDGKQLEYLKCQPFFPFFPKVPKTTILQYLFNISTKSRRMKLLFCLQINFKDFFKLIISF